MAALKEKSTVCTGFVFDFETGGTKCNECAATQISVHAIRLDNFEVMDRFNKYIYPYDYQDISQKPKPKKLRSKYDEEEKLQMKYENVALEYSHITMDMLYNDGEDLKSVCEELLEFFKKNTFNVKPSCKPVLIGQNVLFDIGFLQQIFTYTGLYKEFSKIVRGSVDLWGNFQPSYIDTITLSQLALNHDESVTLWNLENLCDLFGVELYDAHDADADVTATFEVLKSVTSKMRNGDSDGLNTMVDTKQEKKRNHFKI